MPYIFGPLGAAWGSQTLAFMWGSIGGYIGVLTFLLAISALVKKSTYNSLKFFLVAWVALTWGKSFGVPFVQGLMNYIPLVKETVFHRYAPPSWELAIIILAAIGHQEWRQKNGRWPFAIMIVLVGVSVMSAWPTQSFWGWPVPSPQDHYKKLTPSVLWTLSGLAVAAVIAARLRGYHCRLALACLLILDASRLFIVPELSGNRGGHIDDQAVTFLRDHQGLSRSYTLGPMAPNYAAYFQIASLNYNVLPAPLVWVRYVDRNILPELVQRTGGWWLWPPLFGEVTGRVTLPEPIQNYAELGVRYVITDPDKQLGLPQVYEDNVMRIWEIPDPAPYFEAAQGGPCQLTHAQRQEVDFDCAAPAILIRHELYMPGWTAEINDNQTEITPHHDVFQQIALPQGHGHVRYDFAPPYVNYGWIAFVIGALGMLAQMARLYLDRRHYKNGKFFSLTSRQ